MAAPVLVVHGHFYQPPRENPWTESVAAEPSAAPAHDWNERITDESYRPNGWARVVDDQGRVVAIVDNYAHLSFNAGPTLLSWMEAHAPDVLARMVEGDRIGGGAIAQAYNHMILPLASERDVRTQVRWGVADFRHRFGRDPEGMWLPETAVNDDVLRVLADEGIGFTILAPSQAARVRPLAEGSLLGHEEPWHEVGDGSIDTRRTYRWVEGERSVDLLFYDGALSHDVAFGIGAMQAQGLVARASGDGLTCVAADGETFGHHHHFAERLLAYALPVAAPRAGVEVRTAAAHLTAEPPTWQAEVKESAWSCAHGVGRWREDCGCSTGGPPGAQQRWRGPLRAALDGLRDAGVEVFERRGAEVFRDPWAARDAYVDVLLGRSIDDFAAEHVVGDLAVARTLLEQQRHALLMYTSCAWFFWDLAGLETVQCLRYAARAIDLLDELGEAPPLDDVLALLGEARSNQPGEGNGVAVWRRHVEPARVDAGRVVAHLALRSVLDGSDPAGPVAVWDVVDGSHHSARRGGVAVAAGSVTLRHRRTGRVSSHAYGVVHLGGLEVAGAVRPAIGAPDDAAAEAMVASLERGERVTTLLRLVSERYGPDEFGIERALPDAAAEIVLDAAATLEHRFLDEVEQLYGDHRTTLGGLAAAGYVLPDHLRRPMARAVGRKLEAAIAGHQGAWEAAEFEATAALVADAAAHGLPIDAGGVSAALADAVLAAAARACAGDTDAVDAATALLDLADTLGVGLDAGPAQQLVYDALLGGTVSEGLGGLGARLGLAVDHLGLPG